MSVLWKLQPVRRTTLYRDSSTFGKPQVDRKFPLSKFPSKKHPNHDSRVVRKTNTTSDHVFAPIKPISRDSFRIIEINSRVSRCLAELAPRDWAVWRHDATLVRILRNGYCRMIIRIAISGGICGISIRFGGVHTFSRWYADESGSSWLYDGEVIKLTLI